MGLSAVEILDIIELVFFVPAIFVSIYVVHKHGLRKQFGWRFLIMICLFRLIGAITSLISIKHPSEGLTITYDIMNNFGLSAVISTALALLDRVNTGMERSGVHPRVFRLLHLPSLAGLILCIIGSTNLFSNNAADISTGLSELKAGICLFLVVYVADILITGYSWLHITKVQSGERRLLVAVSVALPFMAVRMIYSLLCVFANEPRWFSSWSLESTAIWVHGVMGVLMEMIVVVIFITAGLMTEPLAKPLAREGKVNFDFSASRV